MEEEKTLLEERVKELTLQIEKYQQQKVRKDEGGRRGREGEEKGREGEEGEEEEREGEEGGRDGEEGGRKRREGEGGDGQTDNRVNVFSSCVNMCIMTI